MLDTRVAADRAVAELAAGLEATGAGVLPAARTIYLTGSYVRGDWLNSSSDVDVTILSRPDTTEAERNRDLARVKAFVSTTFPTHCPGGIDWGTQEDFPRTQEDLLQVGNYPYYGVFFLDFRQNIRISWGEDFRPLLPEPVDVRRLALPAMERILDRLDSVKDHPDRPRLWASAA
jgi:hypothetical protein